MKLKQLIILYKLRLPLRRQVDDQEVVVGAVVHHIHLGVLEEDGGPDGWMGGGDE